MSARYDADRNRSTGVHQPIAAVVGAVFLLVGILGFVPGVTTDFDDMMVAGHDSGAMLLGVFAVSVLHNVVHLLFGVAGLLLARREPTARTYLIAGGVVYLLLFAYGLVVDHGSDANFVPLNDADDWLHLGLGVGMLALGLLPDRRDAALAKPRERDRADEFRGGRDRPGAADRQSEGRPVGRSHGDSGRPEGDDLPDRQRRRT